MGSGKPKQFARPPPKKKPQKAAALETVDDFQDAADFEESAGGKHRVGDPVKSGRAFVRALDVYEKGLRKHPKSFDLAYNKARLELEISQQPNLVEHVGVPLLTWLQQALQSHRDALALNGDNHDVLFNTAQVLTSLAEQLSEDDEEEEAVPLLREALELLSSALSRQEMMFEQHRLDFPDDEAGGVPLEPDEISAPPQPDVTPGDEEQSATVEIPVTAIDLLDTVHASLSALTTLAPLADQGALQNLGDMAHALTETKAPGYIQLLREDEQTAARFAVAVDRATFVAAYAARQFEFQLIELETYVQRLDSFDIAGKDEDANALSSEAEARTELVLSVIDHFDETSDLPAMLCWKQLSLAQELYTQITKLTSEDAQEQRTETYRAKGDLELLRYRILDVPKTDLSDPVKNSAATLLHNAQTYFKGAVSHAQADGDDEAQLEAQHRLDLARRVAALVSGSAAAVPHLSDSLTEALEECVMEGLVSERLARAITTGAMGSSS